MQISWWTLLLQGVNFIVLVWLLQRFLYRPVRDVIDARKRLQLWTEAEGEKLKSEAEELKRRYEAALAGIDAERKHVLEKAHAAMEAEHEKLVENAKRAAAEELANARDRIESERASSLSTLRGEVAGLGVKLASTILVDVAKSVPDEAVLASLESKLLDLPSGDRQRLGDEIAENGQALDIITARRLDPSERTEWRARLEAAIGRPFSAAFEEDPDLISGAKLRLPHTSVDASWSAQLEQARDEILKVGEIGRS